MERHSFWVKRPQTLFVVVLVLCTLLCGGPLLAFEPAGSSSAGHRMYELKHISPAQGVALLKRMSLGTVTNMPCTKTLLITGGADVCQKAAAVLNLVDAPGQFDVRQIALASSAASLPSNEKIAGAVGDVCIGTFAHPPQATGKARALIDVHNGAVWAVAPIFQLQNIALAVELGPDVLVQRKHVSAGQSPKTGVTPSLMTQNTTAKSEKITQPSVTPRTLLDSPLATAQFSAKPLAAPEQGVLPPRVSETERKPLATDLALAQVHSAGAMAALPPKPAGVGETPEPRSNLTPGQVVPDEVNTPAPAAESVEPILPDVAAQTADEAGPYMPVELIDEDRVVNITLQDKLKIIDLVDLVGKYMNLTYIYDPAQITGEVTLKLNGDLRGSMKVKDLYLLMESVLKFKDFVMTRSGTNIVTIVKRDDALTIDPPVLVGPDGKGVAAGNVIVTRVFKLEHISTKSAQNLLDSMKLSVDVTPIPESDTLIVTAYSHRMARLDELLKMVDKPGDPRKFRSRQLRYTMAETLAEKVKALAEQLESVSVTVGSEAAEVTAATLKRRPNESIAAFNARKARQRAIDAQRRKAAAASSTSTEAEQTKPGVYLDADERTNRILMIGVEEQLKVVEELIDSLDVEQQDPRSLQLYQMKHVEAEEVSRKLAELGIISRAPETSNSPRISGSSRTNERSTAADRARAAAAAATSDTAGSELEFGEEGPTEEPQVVVVESTNSLLVNATAEQHNRIKEIIGYVDNEMLRDEIPYQIYPLENSSPDHLATILQGLIEETTENQDKEGKTQTLTQKREEDIEIVPDPNTYSLIVYASKRNQQWISDLVEQLDKRRPQVLIDVTLVEITKTDEFNYDLNMIENVTGLTNSALNPINTPNSLETLLGGSKGGILDFQSDGGDFTGFYGDKHVQLLLNAVQSKNYGRVLAKPKILVNDNEEGVISTTEKTYVKLESTTAIEGSSSAVSTTANYQDYDAGIELAITPHISEGDLLRLDIGLTRSDFIRSGTSSERPPDTTTSEIGTAVTVPDGSTVILGGLIKLNQTKGGSKVPVLGDLPLLGGLFRSTSNSDDQSKLYVFVKAEVIRPAAHGLTGMEDLTAISERNRLAFEQHEQEFQNYEIIPGVKPRNVEPMKVLDAQ